MPFGKKNDADGRTIDFDGVYAQIIKPAIEDAGLEPIRADEEMSGGIIHQPMFERLILCPFAVADLTTANANVFYELGVRHAVRPASTVPLFAKGGRLPFDVAPLRAIGYDLDANGIPTDPKAARELLARFLHEARDKDAVDSPVFTLVKGFPDIQHLKTNAFQDRVEIASRLAEELRMAKTEPELKAFEARLGALRDVESAVLVKLFLAYRDAKAWQAMVDLEKGMPRPLAGMVMIQEQLGFALNRLGRSDDAEHVLTQLISTRGGTSETYGLLGRVYKDRWQKAPNKFVARGHLDKAIDAYMKGFESDWRDAFPGVNAVTLMEIRTPPDPRRLDILPVVRYAASRRIASGNPDYWDFATLLELAILAKQEPEAMENLGKALACVRSKWEPETTLNNLKMISAARKERNEDEPAWIGEAMQALHEAAQ